MDLSSDRQCIERWLEKEVSPFWLEPAAGRMGVVTGRWFWACCEASGRALVASLQDGACSIDTKLLGEKEMQSEQSVRPKKKINAVTGNRTRGLHAVSMLVGALTARPAEQI